MIKTITIGSKKKERKSKINKSPSNLNKQAIVPIPKHLQIYSMILNSRKALYPMYHAPALTLIKYLAASDS